MGLKFFWQHHHNPPHISVYHIQLISIWYIDIFSSEVKNWSITHIKMWEFAFGKTLSFVLSISALNSFRKTCIRGYCHCFLSKVGCHKKRVFQTLMVVTRGLILLAVTNFWDTLMVILFECSDSKDYYLSWSNWKPLNCRKMRHHRTHKLL